MRFAMLACAFLAVTASAHAEDMISVGNGGLMCRDEKSLADFTASDGSVKDSVRNFSSPAGKRFLAECKEFGPSTTVHVVTKRTNTSIVTYNGQTWYVPNIDFMAPTPDCIREGAKLTMAGRVEAGFNRTDEVDPKKGYRYPRLALDKPVCYLGNVSEKNGRYVSLVGTSPSAFQALMKMVGQHVSAAGTVGSPDNGNQPPDAMMMFDPVVRPAP